MRRFLPLVLATVACGDPGAASMPAPHTALTMLALAGPDVPSLPTSRAERPDSAPRTPTLPDTAIMRGLYVNRWAAQSPRRMRELIGIADSTEIDAFVIDMKDEFGLDFTSHDPMVARNAGHAGTVPHLDQLLDTLRAHHIVPIARVVVFKDSVAARLNPDHVIRTPDGSPWRDKKGLTWVDPYDSTIREYDVRVAEELARMGFAEIQFDYIRFPEPFKSLPPQVFHDANGVSKPAALAGFFRQACARVHRLGARCTADIFGLVTTVPGALEVGQQWESLTPVTDVLQPMVYPSHYPHGAFGIDRPNAEPYRVVYDAVSRAHERDLKVGIETPEHVRPWLQAFTLGKPRYGPQELEGQKRAVYDAGYDGWTLWNPGSIYEPYLSALEKTTVSRRKPFAPKVAAR